MPEYLQSELLICNPCSFVTLVTPAIDSNSKANECSWTLLVLQGKGSLVEVSSLEGMVEGDLDVVQFLRGRDQVLVQFCAIHRVDALFCEQEEQSSQYQTHHFLQLPQHKTSA